MLDWLNQMNGGRLIRHIIALTGLVLYAHLGYAQELRFDEAKRLALDNNKMIKAYEEELETAKYSYDQARGGYLPKINITETGTRTDEPANAAFSKMAQGRFDMNYFMSQMKDPDAVTNYETKIEIIQPIFMNGKIFFGVKQAREMKEASEYTLERVKQTVLYNLHKGFFGVALAERALTTTQKSYERTKRYYDIAGNFYKNGMLVKSDLLVAQSYTLMNEGAIQEAKKQVAVAKGVLQRIIDTDRDWDVVWEYPDYAFRQDLDYYLRVAVKNRQDLIAMGKYLNASKYEEKKSVSRLLPELAVFGNYSQSDDTIFGDAADGYTVGARVKLNVFNGFSDFNHIREQRSRYRSLLNKVADKRLAIKVEVKDGYYSVLSAQKRLEASNKRVDAVREALAITERRFKAGLDKITDLLDREVDVKEAELGMYMSEYDLILSKAKLLFAAGILK